MNRFPVILVVTPSLGLSPWLVQTLASVAALRLPVFHLLSVPATEVPRLQAAYPRVRVVPDAGREAGVYGALNAALEQAPAGWDWFTWLSDGDQLLAGFREAARKHFAQPEPAGVMYGDVELTDPAGGRRALADIERNSEWFPPLLQHGIVPLLAPGMMFRRQCLRHLQGFDSRFRYHAHLDFWLRALLAGETFRCHPLRVARHRVARRRADDPAAAYAAQETAWIVARHFREFFPAWFRACAAFRHRLFNLPRRLGRRRRGLPEPV